MHAPVPLIKHPKSSQPSSIFPRLRKKRSRPTVQDRHFVQKKRKKKDRHAQHTTHRRKSNIDKSKGRINIEKTFFASSLAASSRTSQRSHVDRHLDRASHRMLWGGGWRRGAEQPSNSNPTSRIIPLLLTGATRVHRIEALYTNSLIDQVGHLGMKVDQVAASC